MMRRVLLLEDVVSVRGAFKRLLEINGFTVHEAATLDEALTAIARVAYHVVCIDLALDEADPTNNEGAKLLKALAAYDEGTKAIVVSGQRGDRAHDIAIEAYEEYHLAKWLRKGQFTGDVFLETVQKAASAVSFKVFGKFTTPLDAMLNGLDSALWIDQALRVLKPHGGFTGLDRMLSSLLQDLLPIRPLRDAHRRALIDPEAQRVLFHLWSRAMGSAVVCSLAAQDDAQGDNELLVSKLTRFGVTGSVMRQASLLPDAYE